MIKKIYRKIKLLFFPQPLIYNELIYNSYSQAGEDAVLSFLFADKKIKKIEYLDIGTNNPDHDNNTYLFYIRGNRGVCVEADKSLVPIINSKRPEDKVLNVGVSVGVEVEADFYLFDVKGLNTFDKEEALKRESFGNFKITEVVKVPLMNINRIIRDNFESYPVFLSIDIEGLDLEVLKSLNFDMYPIPVVCVETCTYSENHVRPKDVLIADFMIAKGYEIYADTYINTIFVNKDWFYSTQ